MPTGYTAYIKDGKITSGKEFLKLCTRAFGIAVDLKDESLDVPTPNHFEPHPYYEMRVVELIRKLQEIGYDENTELTFSCTDGETGEYYVIPFEEITYGEELTGEPYENDVIDIEVDVDSVEEYIKAKAEVELEKQTQRVIKALEDCSL